MAIRDHSPHLASVLNRYKIPTKLLDQVFDHSINLGGLEERDFIREEGSSYNPRPARVGLILVDNAKVSDPLVISVGMLAAVDDEALADETLLELSLEVIQYSDQLKSLWNEACTPIYLWNRASLSIEARTIALAVLLDRARHAHLSKLSTRLELLAEIKTEMELGLNCSGDIEPKLWQLLKAWCDRYSMLAIQTEKLRASH